MPTTLTTIPLDRIVSAGNVRGKVGDVRELAASIEAVGLLNPLTVRPVVGGQLDAGVTLIAGHRRLKALKALGWTEAPVIVDDEPLEDGGRVARQLVENLQREDLSPIEEGRGLAELAEVLGSQTAAAKAVGRSKGHVSKRIKLTTLPPQAHQALEAGLITNEDAFELTKLDQRAVLDVVAQFHDGADYAGRRLLEREVRNVEHATRERKAAKAVAGQEHRAGIDVYAVVDLPKGAKPIDGWDGIAVDYDEHQVEPCNVLGVGYRWSSDDQPTERFYCTDPARHEPDGDSPTKLIDTAERYAEERAERERRDAELKARRLAAIDEARNIGAGFTDRNVALRVLALRVLETFNHFTMAQALEAVGVDLGTEPEQPGELARYYDELRERVASPNGIKATELYRAAITGTLIELAAGIGAWRIETPESAAIAALTDFEEALTD